MKSNKIKNIFWIDTFLFIGFVISFFMDLTGLTLHQWLGLAVGILAVYHLIVHWEWVNALTSRFFGRTSDQARMYYLIDFGLLAGFLLIFITGLIISTWFSLPLENYLFYKHWHIAISVSILLLVVIKIAVHWRWIVRTLRRSGSFVKSPRIASQPGLVRVNSGRRDFLKLMGIVSAAAFLAATSALDEVGEAYANEPITMGSDETIVNNLITDNSSNSLVLEQSEQITQDALDSLPMSESEDLKTEPTLEASPTQTPTEQATPTQDVIQQASENLENPDTNTPARLCTVRCQKGCAYPGHCRRYVDSNSNGLCDLGECI